LTNWTAGSALIWSNARETGDLLGAVGDVADHDEPEPGLVRLLGSGGPGDDGGQCEGDGGADKEWTSHGERLSLVGHGDVPDRVGRRGYRARGSAASGRGGQSADDAARRYPQELNPE
jgi:hypothetical protein